MLFNKNKVVFGRSIEQPTEGEIRNTPSLWNIPVEEALQNTSGLIRKTIDKIDIRGDRKYILVSTKIQFIVRGFLPSFPGWHTDGTLSAKLKLPQINYFDFMAQNRDDVRYTRFHMLVTGNYSLTEFLVNPIELKLPQEPQNSFEFMNDQVEEYLQAGKQDILTVPTCTIVDFDWWNIHRASVSSQNHWRLWIRVTESDFISKAAQKPRNEIYKTQRKENIFYKYCQYCYLNAHLIT